MAQVHGGRQPFEEPESVPITELADGTSSSEIKNECENGLEPPGATWDGSSGIKPKVAPKNGTAVKNERDMAASPELLVIPVKLEDMLEGGENGRMMGDESGRMARGDGGRMMGYESGIMMRNEVERMLRDESERMLRNEVERMMGNESGGSARMLGDESGNSRAQFQSGSDMFPVKLEDIKEEEKYFPG